MADAAFQARPKTPGKDADRKMQLTSETTDRLADRLDRSSHDLQAAGRRREADFLAETLKSEIETITAKLQTVKRRPRRPPASMHAWPAANCRRLPLYTVGIRYPLPSSPHGAGAVGTLY